MRTLRAKPRGSHACSAKYARESMSSPAGERGEPSLPEHALPAACACRSAIIAARAASTARWSKPMTTAPDGLLLDCRLATLADDRRPYGLVEDGALAWKNGRITYAGPRDGMPAAARDAA